jgi:hypothetical protein
VVQSIRRIQCIHTHPLLAIVGGVDSGIQEYNVFAPLKASVSVPSIKNPYPGYCVSCTTYVYWQKLEERCMCDVYGCSHIQPMLCMLWAGAKQITQSFDPNNVCVGKCLYNIAGFYSLFVSHCP